eukprot:CAMPEP_0171242762 /NCGR_PEP_ID=MMETSP0790-20130122/45893_1 /TAXON_ID=2925 /ORGANISM="Alexandrium catenella, Strain OF101" /LENGTH=68 /DNA_ID=CAMNT_0011709643 /DNA_START=366 /DNA_END=570 /DNA_ORIENTATION=+
MLQWDASFGKLPFVGLQPGDVGGLNGVCSATIPPGMQARFFKRSPGASSMKGLPRSPPFQAALEQPLE